MELRQAIEERRSIRAFLPTPVSDDSIRTLLDIASRAPSGGNVQPWRVYVVNGSTMGDLLEHLEGRPFDEPEYEVYPPGLWEPHRTARFELGEAMYAELGIERADRAGRLEHLARNYRFFDAPAAIFCFIDQRMGPPQWSDLGMFLQTFMLAAVDAGLATCPQEAWASYGSTIHSFVGAARAEMLFAGVAIGHADADAAVNKLQSERLPVDEFATFVSPASRRD